MPWSKVVNHPSKTKSGTCKVCEAKAETVFWIPDGYDIGQIVPMDFQPPFHEHCVCTLETFEKYPGGKVPSTESYQYWRWFFL